jgi:hypothetical protein
MQNTTPIPRWAKWSGGLALLAIALAAGCLGLTLNVMHGLETGLAAAVAFGLADGAKIVVPIVCGIVGWTKQTQFTAAICVLASLWAATNTYLDRAGRELLAKEHGQTVYTDAERGIGELTAEAASLRSMAEKEAGRKGCGQNCRDLTAKAADAARRLQDARAKRAVIQPVEASGLAAMLAMAGVGTTDRIARALGAVKAALFILLVEALVWLSVPAAALLGHTSPRRAVDVVDLTPIEETTVAPAAIAARPGTRAYYLARLQVHHPAIAQRVEDGELSVFAASVAAGLRKAPKQKQLAIAYAK